MTPKEKAKELVDSFKGIVYPYIGSSMLTNDADEGVILNNAKICASIVVGEIIEVINKLPIDSEVGFNDEYASYWENVATEIQKL